MTFTFSLILHSLQLFFTLTSGDMRWSSNFTPELEKMGAKINYNVDVNGKESVTVEARTDDGKLSICSGKIT